MNPIDKLIFDKLAAGQGVNLPDVGSLYVERDAAKFISRSEIRPPHNKVLFSRKRTEDFDSIIDLVITAGNVKRSEATAMYKEWLEKSREAKDHIEMNSVGVLANDFFYPSVLLHDTLNPVGQDPVALKGRSNGGRTTLITVLCVLGAAVIALYVLFGLHVCPGSLCRDDAPVAGQTVTQEKTAGETAVTATGSAATAETGERSAEDVIQQNLEQYAQSATGGAPAVSAPAAPVYHVVVGVFTREYNADKLIEDDYFSAGRESYSKIPYNGRTMVTIFSSPDRNAAFARREQLLDLDYDIWVYTK